MRPRRVALLLAGLLLASCATPPSAFVALTSRDGIVNWYRGATVSAARMTFQRDSASDRRLAVTTASGALLALTRSGEKWTATGPLAAGSWRGLESEAPAALAGWLSVVEALDGAVAAPPGDSDVRTGRFSVRYFKAENDLRGLELVTVATGDRFRVTFLPATKR